MSDLVQSVKSKFFTTQRLTSFLALTLQTPQVASPIPAKATMVLLRQLDGLDHHPPEGLQTSFGYGYWP